VSGLWLTIVLGAAVGLFATAAWRFAVGVAPPLGSLLERIDQPAATVDPLAASGFKQRLGRRARPILAGWGLSDGRRAADARMALIDPDAHVASKVLCGVFPPVFAAAAAAVCGLGGLAVPGPVIAVAALGGAAAGFVAPDVGLRRRAVERRREFTLAFGAYLDLVAISLAGGMGTEAALTEAARVGDSWVFQMLRRAIEVAQIDGTTIWAGLGRLGGDLQVPAVVELAATVALAGNEGAKVRQTIAVKADGLRAAELADAESRAHAATERMAIPTAMLLFGFVLLIGFPAVITVLGGL
jgi:tight adherence protein C